MKTAAFIPDIMRPRIGKILIVGMSRRIKANVLPPRKTVGRRIVFFRSGFCVPGRDDAPLGGVDGRDGLPLGVGQAGHSGVGAQQRVPRGSGIGGIQG